MELEHLKNIVKRAEERIANWKEQLTDYHKNKFDIEWYKDLLREGKNRDETLLKNMREELTYFNQGLNPPFCYPNFNQNDKT